MVRIVSGVQPQEQDTGAVMRGYQNAQGARLRENEDRRRQQHMMMAMQEQQLAFKQAQAQQQQMLNQQAQMGDAQALQEVALRAQKDPKQVRSEDALKMLSGITDPKARALAVASIQDLFQQEDRAEMQQAAAGEIERAAKDGLIDEAGMQTYQQRLQAGEEPENIVQEFGKARMQRAESQANITENQRVMEPVLAMVQAAPQGEDRRRAEILLAQWEQSPSLQEQQGAGAKLANAIQRELTKSRETQVANYVAKRKDMESFARDYSKMEPEEQEAVRARMQRFGPTDPEQGAQSATPAQRQHSAGMKAEKEKRYPGSTGQRKPTTKTKLPTAKLKQAKTEDDVVAALQEAGIPLTAANITAAEEAWLGRGE